MCTYYVATPDSIDSCLLLGVVSIRSKHQAGNQTFCRLVGEDNVTRYIDDRFRDVACVVGERRQDGDGQASTSTCAYRPPRARCLLSSPIGCSWPLWLATMPADELIGHCCLHPMPAATISPLVWRCGVPHCVSAAGCLVLPLVAGRLLASCTHVVPVLLGASPRGWRFTSIHYFVI